MRIVLFRDNGTRGETIQVNKIVKSDAEWRQLRADLRAETNRWLQVLGTSREVREIELNGMFGSIAHLAYHLGAIRQINSLLRGPVEGSS